MTLGSPVTIELTIVAAYALERHRIAACEGIPHLLERGEVVLASPQVLADGNAVALELLVVAHQPRHVLGGVLARLGLEVAEAPVERDAHAALELRVAGDALVETRIERLAAVLEAQQERL